VGTASGRSKGRFNQRAALVAAQVPGCLSLGALRACHQHADLKIFQLEIFTEWNNLVNCYHLNDRVIHAKGAKNVGRQGEAKA